MSVCVLVVSLFASAGRAQHVPDVSEQVPGVSHEHPGHPLPGTAHQDQRPGPHRRGGAHVHQQPGHAHQVPRVQVRPPAQREGGPGGGQNCLWGLGRQGNGLMRPRFVSSNPCGTELGTLLVEIGGSQQSGGTICQVLNQMMVMIMHYY